MKQVIVQGKRQGTKPQPPQKELKLLDGVNSKNWGTEK